MNKNSKYIIIYHRQDEDFPFLGFSIMESQEASQYMKAVKRLADEECMKEFDNRIYDAVYDENDFNKMKISESEEAILDKLFDVEESTVGMFPDAVNDAYDNGLLDEV